MKFYADWGMRIAHGQLTDFQAFYGQPLYAYLLGGAFALTGFHPVVISVFQAMLDALTAVLIFRIARIAFAGTARGGRVIGTLAALGWAFFVPAATYSALLIPTSWTVAASWFCIWWLLERRARASHTEWFLVALLLGVIAMMSAAILFLALLLLAGAALRRSAVAAAMIGAGILAGTAPCWLHNSFVARDPVFLSAHSGVNFWIGNNPESDGYPKVPLELPSDQSSLLQKSIATAEAAAGRPLPRSEVARFWSAKAHGYIGGHLAEWLALICLKAKNFWNSFQYDDLSSITAFRDAAIVPPGIAFGLIAALGLPGALLALRKPAARWVIAAVFLQMIALLPMFVNERYRLPAAPGLLLLSAYLLTELWRTIAAANALQIAAVLGLLGLGTWFTTLPPNEPALWSLDNYKTARRQLAADDYPRAESRLRRALATMVPAGQISAAVANSFAESAQAKMNAGETRAALATIEEAVRINPADQRLQVWRREMAAQRTPQPD